MSTKSALNVATFVSYVLPPLLCYSVMAVMAITPQTRTLRMALWPVIALLALRATYSVAIVSNKSGLNSHIDLTVGSSLRRSLNA